MDIFEKEKEITHFTTFGLPLRAKLFAEYDDVAGLIRICRSEEYRGNLVFHIGGGSNIVAESYFDGLILHSGIKGLTRYDKNTEEVFVIAGAGEKWTDLVDFCVRNGLGGLENLAGIPGEVGASPVQNVGAYGVEAADFIHSVECFDRETLKVVRLVNDRNVFSDPDASGNICGFGYRNSNFKTVWKEKYIVLRVSFRLRKSIVAQNIDYGGLKGLETRIGHRPSISEVRDEVIKIRNSKLPDPAEIGSAGSFFKNPVVRRGYYEFEMLNFDKSIPCYDIPRDPGHVKIPAGWLIDHAGLKGFSIGGAVVYPENCLVIANKGAASFRDVRTLASHVEKKVNSAFHVSLEPEVNYLDSTIKVTVLGSGTSKGVPELMCDCSVCKSENPVDHRLRSSVYVETMGIHLLIDASPDFREQALRAGIRHIDGVLLTHEHYDHVGGIDDLRPYCLNSPVDLYVREDVDRHLRRRLDYCFASSRYPGVPAFGMHVIANRPFFIKGVEVIPVEVLHGSHPIFGFRIGKFGYITDAKHISEEERDKLRGLDVLIVNALREREHFAHFTISEALSLIADVKPRRAFLTHLCHEAGLHHILDSKLPPNVSPLYDGQVITVD